MNISGQQSLSASPGEVWNSLFDPEVLKACIPGCEEITGSPKDGSVDAVVVAKVGPVKARIRGTIVLSDANEPESLTLSAAGKGGAAGFAKGSARIRLASTDSGTELSYDAEFHVGGKLAQIGSRLVGGYARKFTAECFSRLQAQFDSN
ncbi:MAG: carbon monoxide dehydrogenase subunit G [Paracoccaceae bacterium]|nr:carbon monoxide dehydrogenase subunit G [Paracoccaceae bacterium]MDE2913829.1 carbon monoxide dehydrogenase subunit G [Paracoccaceae bacterium]